MQGPSSSEGRLGWHYGVSRPKGSQGHYGRNADELVCLLRGDGRLVLRDLTQELHILLHASRRGAARHWCAELNAQPAPALTRALSVALA